MTVLVILICRRAVGRLMHWERAISTWQTRRSKCRAKNTLCVDSCGLGLPSTFLGVTLAGVSITGEAGMYNQLALEALYSGVSA